MTPKTILVQGSLWVAVAFALNQGLRLVSSIILARILAPDIFGIMVIVFSLRTGIELISDVGFGQSIVANKSATDKAFLDTAWTLRLVRGLLLWGASFAIAVPVARIYEQSALAIILPAAGAYFVLTGLGSLSVYLWQRDLRTASVAFFDLAAEAVSIPIVILFAYSHPNVWSLVLASLLPTAIRALASYVVMPGLRHRFRISKSYAGEILSFGRWIFFASLIYFLSSNFDRLYLGRVVPLEALGVYGIARNLAEILNTLVGRVNYIAIFPFIAAHSELPRSELRAEISKLRVLFLGAAAIGTSIFVSGADVLVSSLYDVRYSSAGWMLAVLSIGLWFSILCTVNESTLLGFSRPAYGAVANAVKFVWVLIGVPYAMITFGFAGVIVVIALSDLWRYLPILAGQTKEEFSFFLQDAVLTAVFLSLVISLQGMRFAFGFGTSFRGSPLLIHLG